MLTVTRQPVCSAIQQGEGMWGVKVKEQSCYFKIKQHGLALFLLLFFSLSINCFLSVLSRLSVSPVSRLTMRLHLTVAQSKVAKKKKRKNKDKEMRRKNYVKMFSG